MLTNQAVTNMKKKQKGKRFCSRGSLNGALVTFLQENTFLLQRLLFVSFTFWVEMKRKTNKKRPLSSEIYTGLKSGKVDSWKLV